MEHTRQITLKAARINSELTQKQAAKRLGISEQTLSNYERGFSYPDVSMVQQMTELYRVDFNAISWKMPGPPERGAPRAKCGK